MNTNERRVHPRIPYRASTQIASPQQEPAEGGTVDISRGVDGVDKPVDGWETGDIELGARLHVLIHQSVDPKTVSGELLRFLRNFDRFLHPVEGLGDVYGDLLELRVACESAEAVVGPQQGRHEFGPYPGTFQAELPARLVLFFQQLNQLRGKRINLHLFHEGKLLTFCKTPSNLLWSAVT